MELNAKYFLVPLLFGTSLISALVIFIIIFIFRYRQAQLNSKLEKQQIQHAQLKAEIEIRENTLDYISRELHDNIGQIASVLKINVGLVMLESNTCTSRLEECQELIRYLISEIKSISLSLNSGNISKIGFISALQNEITRINNMGIITINMNAPLELPFSGSEKELLLYRICQEALNNILKHSRATSASINIIDNSTELLVQIIDNGVGFSVQNIPKNSLGLSNFKERCKFIGATYSILSEPGHGTKIELRLPIEK